MKVFFMVGSDGVGNGARGVSNISIIEGLDLVITPSAPSYSRAPFKRTRKKYHTLERREMSDEVLEKILEQLTKIRNAVEPKPAPPAPVAPEGFTVEFMAFLSKYGVIGLAIAVIIGGAAGSLVSALVSDILMPIITFFIPGGAWREATWGIRSNCSIYWTLHWSRNRPPHNRSRGLSDNETNRKNTPKIIARQGVL